MKSYLIEMFGVSLALTIVVELIVVFLLGKKRLNGRGQAERPEQTNRQPYWKGMLLVVLANILTNPPAVLLCWLGRLYAPDIPETAVQLAVEIGVVAVEACVYRSFGKKSQWVIDRPVRLAIVANVCSWLLGRFLCLCEEGFYEKTFMFFRDIHLFSALYVFRAG